MHMHMPNIPPHTHIHSQGQRSMFSGKGMREQIITVVAKERKRNIQKGDEMFQEKAIYFYVLVKSIGNDFSG